VDPNNKSSANKVAFGIAQRFASLALPLGFSIGEFLAASKEAFIEAATELLKSRGIRPTTSRIAVMTGLTRAEVSRIRDGNTILPAAVSEPRTERVMNAWFTDPEFLDEDGAPRVLPEFGELSFELLVKKYSGDMPRRALLEELIAGGMATRENGDRIRALRRHHCASSISDEELSKLETEVELFVANPGTNATRTITVEFPDGIPPSVRRNINQRTERFLEGISDYLHAESARISSENDGPKTRFRLLVTHGESNPEN